MKIDWLRNPDAALALARIEQKPVLLDFSAAPLCSGCARLQSEVYPDEHVIRTIAESFIPVRIDIRQQPRMRGRFEVLWTPTQLLLDADGIERHRIEWFLPAEHFVAELELGLARLDFEHEEQL